MKLAYIVTRADAVGGASIHVRDLARAMRERGHEVTVLIGGRGPVTMQLGAAGVPYVALGHLQRAIHPLRDWLAYRELVRELQSLRPDVVSCHTAKAGLLGRAAARRLRIPAVYTPHGLAIGHRISPVLGPLFGVVERVAARWSAAIVCVCEAERQLALDHRLCPPGLLQVIYNGMPDIPATLRAKPAEEPVRLCSVARFEAPKDHATLLRALSTLRDRQWRLELVGDGPLAGELRALATALSIADRIEWSGYLPDPAPALARSQVFLLSSRSEAFPRSILEAMRAGLPVIASDVGGVREAVQHESSGLVVPAGDANALAAATNRLLQSAALRQRMGDGGRQTYQERFRFERMAEETAALYERIAGGIGQDMGNMLSGLDRPAMLLADTAAAPDYGLPGELLLNGQSGLLGGMAQRIKRVFDVLSALGLMLLAIPFGVCIAIAIALETRGPVFFQQSRIGKGMRRFSIWKFRSMAVNSEELLRSYLDAHPGLEAEWKATHKLKDDPRVTRVGRFLRRRSLDELPQLWNVLKGEMSLIGPRPIVDEEIPKFGEAFALYLSVKPGLTGLWQVSGRSDTSYRRRVELDSHYIRHWSLWLDVKVIWKTVGVVLRAHGAY